MDNINNAVERFKKLLEMQMERVELIKQQKDFINYQELKQIVIGVVAGDGIGPAITKQAHRIMEFILAGEVESGRIRFEVIDGLTIENRLKESKAIPDDVLAKLKECHVILKGPTTTPDAGAGTANIESANVAMRKSLDLFANVRPVKVAELGIDWTFFRENTEGAYAVGSMGVQVNEDLAVDFTVTTREGSERIIRAAFEYAVNNGKKRVTAVTKANVIKTTDGNFLKIFREIATEYPSITADDWYIDIMTAKLIDEKRRNQFEVMVLPNLYGDILTDEAAEIQGGVGTAGSANIGKRYAMFEAIHGSAPRMISEGRADFADPCSIIRAAAMLMNHIGYRDEARRLTTALDFCMFEEAKLKMTGRADGATSAEFADYIMSVIHSVHA